MKTSLEKYTQILILLLWLLQLLTILFISCCYYLGLFLTDAQIIISAIVLIVTQFAVILSFDPNVILIITLITGHISMLLTWGNIIPFIQFAPFIITYLMAVHKKQAYMNLYLTLTITLTLFEIFKILPIITNGEFEMGTPNLVILIVLQVITFVVWRNLLNLYKLIEEINILGLPELLTRTSRGFIVSTLAKGLYVSILFHFLNNFLNSIVWGAPASESRIKIIKIISESDREDSRHEHSITDIINAVDIPRCKNFSELDCALTSSDAKTLFLLLHNIASNYRKCATKYTLHIQIQNPNTFLFLFTSKNKTSPQQKQIWSRNLGTMKQFLQLTKKGDLQIVTGPNFQTILAYELTGQKDEYFVEETS